MKERCAGLKEKETSPEKEKDVYYSKNSYTAALLSAQGALVGVRAILDEESSFNRGYCIIRPPGHHAKCAEPAGFCFFNNVAIATRVARQ